MTFSATYDPVVYAGNGISTRFSTLWPFYAPTHVRVERINAAGVATPLVFGTDYTVEETEPRRGTVVATAAPDSDVSWRITRRTPLVIGYESTPQAVPPAGAPVFIAVGTHAMIGRSVDDGATFQSVGPPDVIPSGASSEPWFGCVDSDGGSVWCAIAEYVGIWRSSDGGLTWAILPGTYTDDGNTSTRWLWIAYAGNDVWLATEHSNYTAIWRSIDNGATWAQHAHGVAFNQTGPGDFPYQIACDIATGRAYSRADQYYLHGMSSADRGVTWAYSNDAVSEYIFPVNLSFVGGTQQLFVSANKGYTATSATAANGTWTEHHAVTPDDGSLGPFVWDGTQVWGVDINGHGVLKAATMGTAFASNQPSGSDFGPLDVASDGAGVTLYCGSAIKRVADDMSLTTATLDTGLNVGFFKSIAWSAGT